MAKKKYIQKITWVRKKIADPYNSKAWIDLEIFVPKPTRDNPLPCLLVSIRNGHSKLFFRLEDVGGYSRGFSLSRKMKEKLKAGLLEANREADEISRDFQLLMARRKYPKSALVDTETGEILASLEKELKGEKK